MVFHVECDPVYVTLWNKTFDPLFGVFAGNGFKIDGWIGVCARRRKALRFNTDTGPSL